jgi:hypothetical protein
MKDTIIETYELDADKKEQLTRATLEKLLRQIKDELRKQGKLKVVISS